MLRAPVWLYRARLGWLLGNRFLLLTHRGRRTGQIHQTVLEVVRFNPTETEWVVVSGFGASADWLRNLQAHPAVRVEVGRRRFVPTHRLLDEAERRDLLAAYQQHHPRTARRLGRWLFGTPIGANDESMRELAAHLPAVAFRPADGRVRIRE